jgi:hypothetical protein
MFFQGVNKMNRVNGQNPHENGCAFGPFAQFANEAPLLS